MSYAAFKLNTMWEDVHVHNMLAVQNGLVMRTRCLEASEVNNSAGFKVGNVMQATKVEAVVNVNDFL